jgi:hypothetical protein
MKMKTKKDLFNRLRTDRIVSLSEEEWSQLAGSYEEIERHDTVVAGQLLIVRTEIGLAAVERPEPGKRVVRLLSTPDAARAFVQGRLALYERMWDGCGCKVDYYSQSS